jgi:hypothetical protein
MSELKLKDSRPNRQGVADQVRTLLRSAREMVEGADPATLVEAPPGGGWSPVQCLEHLNETARLYLPVIADAMDRGRADGLLGRPAPGLTLLGRIVVWSQEPPVRLRMRTRQPLEPPEGGLDPASVLEEFELLHEELIVRINESGSLDRQRIRIRSVLAPRLQLSLGDWFAFLAAHARRHLWQAEQALERAPGQKD